MPSGNCWGSRVSARGVSRQHFTTYFVSQLTDFRSAADLSTINSLQSERSEPKSAPYPVEAAPPKKRKSVSRGGGPAQKDNYPAFNNPSVYTNELGNPISRIVGNSGR